MIINFILIVILSSVTGHYTNRTGYVGFDVSYKFNTEKFGKIINATLKHGNNYVEDPNIKIKINSKYITVNFTNLDYSYGGLYNLKAYISPNRLIDMAFYLKVKYAKCSYEKYPDESINGMYLFKCYTPESVEHINWRINGHDISSEYHTFNYATSHKIYDVNLRQFVKCHKLLVTVFTFDKRYNLTYGIEFVRENRTRLQRIGEPISISSRPIKVIRGGSLNLKCSRPNDKWSNLHFSTDFTKIEWMVLPGSNSTLNISNINTRFNGFYKCTSDALNNIYHVTVLDYNSRNFRNRLMLTTNDIN